MTEREVMRDVMKVRGWSQQKLAEEAGFKSQSNITAILNANTKGVRMDTFLRVLDAMGCELVVRDKMGTKKEWLITSSQEQAERIPTTEELLMSKKITFEEAVARGWRPTAAMLDKMLGDD